MHFSTLHIFFLASNQNHLKLVPYTESSQNLSKTLHPVASSIAFSIGIYNSVAMFIRSSWLIMGKLYNRRKSDVDIECSKASTRCRKLGPATIQHRQARSDLGLHSACGIRASRSRDRRLSAKTVLCDTETCRSSAPLHAISSFPQWHTFSHTRNR